MIDAHKNLKVFFLLSVLVSTNPSCKKAGEQQNSFDSKAVVFNCVECYEDFDLFDFKGLYPVRTDMIPETFIRIIEKSKTRVVLEVVGFHNGILAVETERIEFKHSEGGFEMHHITMAENGIDSVYMDYFFRKDHYLKYREVVNKPIYKHEKERRITSIAKVGRNGYYAEVTLIGSIGKTSGLVFDSIDRHNKAYREKIMKITLEKDGYTRECKFLTYNHGDVGKIKKKMPIEGTVMKFKHSFYPNDRFSIFWNLFLRREMENNDKG